MNPKAFEERSVLIQPETETVLSANSFGFAKIDFIVVFNFNSSDYKILMPASLQSRIVSLSQMLD